MWGGSGVLGLRGWAGGDGGCQCWEFGPDWPISILGVKLSPRSGTYQDYKITECGGDDIMESRSDIGRLTSRCVPDQYIIPIFARLFEN